MKDFLTAVQVAGAAVTLAIAFHKLRGKQLEEAHKFLAVVGIVAFVAPMLRRMS